MVRRGLSFIRVQALSGSVAGGLVGAVDGAMAAAQTSGARLASLAAPVGLGLVLGWCLGLLLALPMAWWRWAPGDGELHRVDPWPARLLALGVLAIPGAPMLYLAFALPIERFARPANQVAAAVLIALAALGVAWPLADLLRVRITQRLGRWLPPRDGAGALRAQAVWSAGVIAAGLLAVAAGYFGTDVWVALGPAPFVGLAVYAVGHWGAALALSALEARRRPPVLERWAQMIIPPMAGIVLFVLLCSVGRQVTNPLMAHSRLTPPVLTRAWSHLDSDGDGFAGALGGGDCDDEDASRSPSAVDLPGNGADEDCSGRDAKPLPVGFSAKALVPTGLQRLARPSNVLLVTVEALRWDAVDVGSSGPSTTPHLAAIAAEGTWFERAYAPGPATHLTLLSLMTGRYPSRLGWELGRRLREVSRTPTLAARLDAHGLATWAFVSKVVHDRIPRLGQGFDRYETASKANVSSAALVDAAIASLPDRPTDDGFFLWVHLVEPHWPHASGATESLRSGYRAEVAAADRHLGRLLDALSARGLDDETLLVVTGDHAEALGAHGVRTHGVTLYETEVRVPLLVRFPGAPRQRRDEPVSLVDVAPTLLDALGISTDVRWDGRTLLPTIVHGRGVEPRIVLSESYNPLDPPAIWLSVYWDRWKLMRRRHEGRDELFDVVADPGEENDLIDESPDVAEALKLEASRYAEQNPWDGEAAHR